MVWLFLKAKTCHLRIRYEEVQFFSFIRKSGRFGVIGGWRCTFQMRTCCEDIIILRPSLSTAVRLQPNRNTTSLLFYTQRVRHTRRGVLASKGVTASTSSRNQLIEGVNTQTLCMLAASFFSPLPSVTLRALECGGKKALQVDRPKKMASQMLYDAKISCSPGLIFAVQFSKRLRLLICLWHDSPAW